MEIHFIVGCKYVGIIMYVVNPETLKNQYECNSIIAKYLMDNNIPLLAQQCGIFYFANTDALKNELEKMPFWLRVYKYLRGGT